jgi:cysteine sulfinate desulfinase/cysteine desulfurase-like protein
MVVYLDNNATIFLDAEVLQAMLPYLEQTAGNAGACGPGTTAVRVSFGKNNSMSDVAKLLTALSDIIAINQHSPVIMASNV